jgi:hypothetical protein
MMQWFVTLVAAGVLADRYKDPGEQTRNTHSLTHSLTLIEGLLTGADTGALGVW